MSRLQKMIGIAGFVFVLSLGIEDAWADCPTYPSGFTCECNGDDTKWVCAKWAAPGTPSHNFDFTVAYVSGVPDVTLSTADLGWELYSEVIIGGAAADLGTLALDDDGADDYEVRISKAANVGTINLDDTGFTGYSSLKGSSFITGNLGGLTLVKDGSDNGGVLDTLYVSGNLTATVTVPKVVGILSCTGKLIGDADLIFGEIGDDSNSAWVTIGGGLECAGEDCPNITVTVKIYDSLLDVPGDVPSGSTIEITELEEPDPLEGFVTELRLSGSHVFAGTLDLPNGLANADTKINVAGCLSGVIDLHDGAVAGEIAIYEGTADAEIKRGGAVSCDVYLGQNISANDLQYNGTATFASVTSTGEIATQVLSGGPTVRCHFGGTLTVTGSMAGLIEIVGDLLSGAEINLDSVSGNIVIEDDCAGSVDLDASLKGDVEIEEDLTGSVTVSADASGDIHIVGDMTGSVTVGGALANGHVGGGRILVTGETNGPIKVGEKTGTLTLIQLAGGLASGGRIEINTTEGKFNAEGNIHIGGPIVISLPAVTFDGCIRIYDDSELSPQGGDLEGDLTVVGCHANGDELTICIDGSDNGNVTLEQTGCDPANASWDCFSPGCP